MREPRNFAFWKDIIRDPEKSAEFMARGNERQKKELRKVFKYIERLNRERQKDLFKDK
ncbi:MAG: hypothetical protein GF408_05245 [Candidatus Omnitrophica bacterium]|nr:hypothetical protein [Candidatus Omnitrophota bacterium]